MKLKQLLIGFFPLIFLGCAQDPDCKREMKRLIQSGLQPGEEAVLKDKEVLKNCGGFDSVDLYFLDQPAKSYMFDELSRTNKPLTYETIKWYVDSVKKSPAYPEMRESMILSAQLQNKVVNPENWEKDKKLFVHFELTDDEMEGFYEFISRKENSKLTYKEAFGMFIKDASSQPTEPAKFIKLETYEKALARSKRARTPLLIYFTRYQDTLSRHMEEEVFSERAVAVSMKKNFVLYRAFTDDEMKLRRKDQYMSRIQRRKKIVTRGDRNLDIQKKEFGTDDQPYLVIVRPDGTIVADTGYVENVDSLVEFLKRK